jgi:hypothetical protein
MRIAVVTAASGKAYGDLRPEAAMVKGALLYADGVRIVSAKLPLLLVQTGEQMRSWNEIWEGVQRLGKVDDEMVSELLDILRRRRPGAAVMLEGWIAEGRTPSWIFDGLRLVWEEDIVPRLKTAPAPVHQALVRDFLPDFVATYARRKEIPAAPLVSAADDLQLAVRAGVVDFDLLDAQRTYDMDAEELVPETIERLFDAVVAIAIDPGELYPLFDDRAYTIAHLLAGDPSFAPIKQVGLANALIVSLESFPMASMDVVLDVRERLKPSLTRFRATMAEATKELNDFPTDAGFAAAVDDLRTRRIAPALQEIDEDLEDLRARPTLLRGWPKAAAGTIGLAAAAAVKAPELAQLAPMLAGASVAFTTELSKREKFKRQRERNQFFFLHAAERYLAEATDDEGRR